MRTAKSIVALIREQGVIDKLNVDIVDNLLHERAEAMKGRPAEKLEWHLAWLFNGAASLTRRLREAFDSDVREMSDVMSRVNAKDWLEPKRSDLARVYHGRMGEYVARLEEAHETLRRFLDVYEALAVDPPGAE